MIWDRERALDECQEDLHWPLRDDVDVARFDLRCMGCGAVYVEDPGASCSLCGGETFEPVEDLAW